MKATSLPRSVSERHAGCTNVAVCLWSWWPSFEGGPGSRLEDVRDELPAERHVAHVDRCGKFGDVPVGVDQFIGIAEVVVAVEDGHEDLGSVSGLFVNQSVEGEDDAH